MVSERDSRPGAAAIALSVPTVTLISLHMLWRGVLSCENSLRRAPRPFTSAFTPTDVMFWQPLASRLVSDGSKPWPSRRRSSSVRELSRASIRMTFWNSERASESRVFQINSEPEESFSGEPCSTAATRHSRLRHAAALTARESAEMQLHSCSRVSSQSGPNGGVTSAGATMVGGAGVARVLGDKCHARLPEVVLCLGETDTTGHICLKLHTLHGPTRRSSTTHFSLTAPSRSSGETAASAVPLCTHSNGGGVPSAASAAVSKSKNPCSSPCRTRYDRTTAPSAADSARMVCASARYVAGG
eukprot:scaffold17951_cov63-Phaeocystis_antarctica.AAC.2